jgi:sialate O-acetylesterase
MALETYYTFSADALKAEIAAGKYSELRHFMFGSMGNHFEALAPQYVTTWNSAGSPVQCVEGVCDEGFKWHNVSFSASEPSSKTAFGGSQLHSAFAQFSSTCMYFGAELIDARAAEGLEPVPIGLIQSAIGGSQIEAWMDNETLGLCKDQSLTGGAVPEDRGRLYYGMVAPFVNYSVAGWLWYQGENNCGGTMGNSKDGVGYGCSLPAMIDAWRKVWSGSEQDQASRLFGIATLAAGGSEGNGVHMAGMRWSQTANYGVWPNPAMPNTFGAQVYDLGDPWAAAGDGNVPFMNTSTGKPSEPERLNCCFPPMAWENSTGTPGCPNATDKDPAMHTPCGDRYPCALPDPKTGKYSAACVAFDISLWPAGMQSIAKLVQQNSPSGVPGVNFMGGIHPRLKRPVGKRLAYAAAKLLKMQQHKLTQGALTGPTLAGCSYGSNPAVGSRDEGGGSKLTLVFNKSLLGGEGLTLRPFDANETGSWLDSRGNSLKDSNGAMVCTVDPSCKTAPNHMCGNASKCTSPQYFQLFISNLKRLHILLHFLPESEI